MSLKEELINELSAAEGGWVNGEDFAKSHGVSRAAVWKAVKSIQKDGICVNAVRSKGYSLSENCDILSCAAVKSKMKNKIDVIYYPETDSTNNRAKSLINSGLCRETLIVANKQSAGRGRQGKSFYSPADTGIYMSLIVFPNAPLQSAVSSTTAAAVAVCRAIERLCDVKVQIKWVNDVYAGNEKICGILTEAVTDFETQTVSAVVIGVGINVTTSEFPQDVENAGSLCINVKRSAIAAAVADELLKVFNTPCSDFIEYYRSHSMIIGKNIVFIKNGEKRNARALSIDENGGLEVMLENGGTTVLRSGEITIRV